LVCRFYDATPTLEPDPDQLEALLSPRVRALYLIHYLGFPQDAAFWRSWCHERGLLLIEDAAQAWLASLADRPVGSFGDLAIFSLAKTVGVPDGGILLSSHPMHGPSGVPRRGTGEVMNRHATWLLSRSALLAGAGRRFERGTSPLPPDQEYAEGDPDAPSASMTRRLLPHLLRHDPRGPRRRNYLHLLAELGDHVPLAFRRLPDGACPFIFPIQGDDKAALIARLRALGIRTLNFWAFPHPELPTAAFPGAARLRARVIGLPVHQELRGGDLAHIVAAVRRATAPPSSAERRPASS
jgi:hypothetical protein